LIESERTIEEALMDKGYYSNALLERPPRRVFNGGIGMSEKVCCQMPGIVRTDP
jgi:hypothetical protein